MKNKLQSAYKPTPEPFRDSVRSSVHEATAQTIPQKRRLSGAWRVVIAAVILIALIPCAIFGASKLYELIAKPVDNYGLEIDVDRETTADYPAYVKMHVKVPEGFAPNDPNNPNNMKFYSLSADEPYTDGFSLRPMRFESGIAESEFIGYVGSYEELTVCGHAAYRVTVEKNGEPLPWERLYVYYEDVNVTLLIYCKDVTEEQIESFVSGISFTEGTADNFTYLDTPYDERQNADAAYKYSEDNIVLPQNTVLSYLGYDYEEDSGEDTLPYTAQITDIRVTDNINGLDTASFSGLYPPDEITDSDGKLLPITVTVTDFGDGFKEQDKVVDSYEAERVLVLADITYTNNSDKEMSVYVPYCLNVMDEGADGKLKEAGIIDEEKDIHADGYCEREIFYLSPHGENQKGFLTVPGLKAGERMTVTVGFLCSKDMLDKAYLMLYGVNDIVDPKPETDNPYTNYLFKVQNDD